MNEAFFHLESGCVRFWIRIDARLVGASVGKAALHYRYHADRSDDEPLATYLAHAGEIDAAVRRRVAAGALEPVFLRDLDLRAAT